MKKTRWIIGILGIVLVVFSYWQIQKSANGLQIEHTIRSGVPITIIGPIDGMNGSRPLVLIGHGFAGSATVMRGFAYTFAHAGYVVALWDFDGHAANPNPLPADSMSGGLVQNAEIVQAEMSRLGWADSSRLAILGHSMGSGVALSFGQMHPETAATIAVSPVDITVTPDLPHNLLLMAGSLEPQFAANAEQRLAEAGGAGGDPAIGTARKLVIIPNVEHISIIFSPTAHLTALNWLNETFGIQPGSVPYTDRRIIWFGIGLLGTLLGSLGLIPRPRVSAQEISPYSVWKRMLAILAGGGLATLILWALSAVTGLDTSRLLGFRVGGYLLFWFFLAGGASLLIIKILKLPFHYKVHSRGILTGLLVFGCLWIGFGLFAGSVWLPWLLIYKRLIWWPVGVIALLPWFLGMGQASRSASGWGKIGWWIFQSIVVVASLIFAIQLTPALGFLTLILPIFPIILFFQTIPNLPDREAWSYAISGALFVSWLLLAVFPLI